MFKFLKEKLSSAISRISEKISGKERAEEELKPEEKAEPAVAELKEKPPELLKEEPKQAKIRKEAKELKRFKPIKTPEINAQPIEGIEPQPVIHGEEKPEPKEEKKGFFAKLKESIAATVTTTSITQKEFEELFWELELPLMENNVAVEIIEKIKQDLKETLVEKPIKRRNIEETIETALKDSIQGLFSDSGVDIVQEIRKKAEKPYVIVFFGINGSGKTTSIAKLAKMLKDNKLNCVIAAADTFRAASIEQLQLHGDKLNIKVIKHDYGSDPAAVAFDTIKHAKSKNADVVLVDTAGRMHSNKNLMKEMEKIVRVAKPDLKIFVGESITGNDCVEQAKTFNDSLGIDGIILSKLDVDEKGGAAVSVSYITKKPILYFGVGQGYDDLRKFEADVVVRGLGLD